jgi:membrane protease YdiL (CAAX protease family)
VKNTWQKLKKPEIVFIVWSLLALAALLPVTFLLDGSFPLFTVIWILVPLVAVVRSKDASQVGFRAIQGREFLRITGINLAGILAIMLLVEPWLHTYRLLLEAVLSSQSPDTTFAWLLRMPRLPALAGMLLYSGLVTLYGEELFFRGWLLQLLLRRMRASWAISIQAMLFVIPNLLVTFVLPPLQGILYAVVYTFLGIGVIGGWAAWRTQSIWPSFFAATVANLALVAFIL